MLIIDIEPFHYSYYSALLITIDDCFIRLSMFFARLDIELIISLYFIILRAIISLTWLHWYWLSRTEIERIFLYFHLLYILHWSLPYYFMNSHYFIYYFSLLLFLLLWASAAAAYRRSGRQVRGRRGRQAEGRQVRRCGGAARQQAGVAMPRRHAVSPALPFEFSAPEYCTSQRRRASGRTRVPTVRDARRTTAEVRTRIPPRRHAAIDDIAASHAKTERKHPGVNIAHEWCRCGAVSFHKRCTAAGGGGGSAVVVWRTGRNTSTCRRRKQHENDARAAGACRPRRRRLIIAHDKDAGGDAHRRRSTLRARLLSDAFEASPGVFQRFRQPFRFPPPRRRSSRRQPSPFTPPPSRVDTTLIAGRYEVKVCR